MILVTRNTSGFEAVIAQMINPWRAAEEEGSN
jgi:hypothetical protein